MHSHKKLFKAKPWELASRNLDLMRFLHRSPKLTMRRKAFPWCFVSKHIITFDRSRDFLFRMRSHGSAAVRIWAFKPQKRIKERYYWNSNAQRGRSNNKNRRKAIFNWAAKGLFFPRGAEGAAIHTQATIKPCHRPLRETESHVRLKHKLIQNIVPFWKTFATKKRVPFLSGGCIITFKFHHYE